MSLISVRGRPAAASNPRRRGPIPRAAAVPMASPSANAVPAVLPSVPAERHPKGSHKELVWHSLQSFVDTIRAAAGRMADDVPLERMVLVASPDDHALWIERFDSPARTDARLCRTMQARAPWDPA